MRSRAYTYRYLQMCADARRCLQHVQPHALACISNLLLSVRACCSCQTPHDTDHRVSSSFDSLLMSCASHANSSQAYRVSRSRMRSAGATMPPALSFAKASLHWFTCAPRGEVRGEPGRRARREGSPVPPKEGSEEGNPKTRLLQSDFRVT